MENMRTMGKLKMQIESSIRGSHSSCKLCN